MANIIKNTATLNYNNTSTNTCPVVTLVEPALGVGKRAFTDKDGIITESGNVGEDRVVVYDILLVNYSSKKFTNLVIEDTVTIDGYTKQAFVYDDANSSYPNEATTAETNKIKFTVPELGPNSVLQLHYTLKFNADVEIGEIIKNKAQINYDENPNNTPAETKEVEVTVVESEEQGEITATKTGPDTILCGQTDSYVLEFINGEKETATKISVVDSIPTGFDVDLTKITVENGGVILDAADYAVNLSNGKLTIKDAEGKTALNIEPGKALRVTVPGIFTCS